ncbi:MAG: SPOR domain-containing protein [Bacteroidota bacterium]|nr:SPOR domain-containing protein [Bacteroidota bacterium]
MQISQFISTLLYRYECVVVPGFGAFLSHRISAKIDPQSHAFYPPKKRLSFNEKLQSNDGILANYVAETEQISYENAMAKIAKQVAGLNKRLQQNETVTLDFIGSLQRSKSGTLSFEPSYHLNYLTEAFGLAQFAAAEISRELPSKVKNIKDAKTAQILALKKRRINSVIKYAAVVLIILGLGGFLGSNAYIQHINQQNLLAQEAANSALDNQIQEATFVVSSPLPAISLNLEKSVVGDYHIVAGAFRIKNNSERKLRQLKRLGFNARLIGQNRYGLHQVVFESHQLRKDAERALYKIKRTHDPAAWLLIKSVP